MDLVVIGAYVATNEVYVNGANSVALLLDDATTSIPGGASVLDTRWHTSDNAGQGWPDGPPPMVEAG